MNEINCNIEKNFVIKDIPSAVPLAYQALYLLNKKMEEIRTNELLRLSGEEINEPNSKKTVREIPTEQKIALTVPEAAELSNIGQNKINKLLKTPNCPFALFVGAKKLVKRKEFEKFISNRLEI